MSSLKGKVAIVTGASRGIGKGVALALGDAGATVYITGRTMKSEDRPTVVGKQYGGTLEDTAAEVTRRGGKGIAIGCDHSKDDQVKAVFDRVFKEQGKLDLLVNNAYLWHESILSGKKFWELPIAIWDNQATVGLRSAYVASIYAAQIMVPQKHGLIANISSSVAGGYILATAYGVTKAALDRLSSDIAHELRPHNVASVSIWPGPIATEKIATLTGSADNPSGSPLHAGKQESPVHVGRAIAAIAADPNIMEKSGRVLTTTSLGKEYGFTDIDGTLPLSVEDFLWPPPPSAIYRPLPE